MPDFLLQMENMDVDELLEVYAKAKELIPLRITNPADFGRVLDSILGNKKVGE